MEIERKFLVTSLPDNYESYPHHEILQGYLATNPTVRIRQIDNRYILTIKEHQNISGAIVNREEEFDMASATFQHLLSKCDGRTVSKVRYLIPLTDTLTAELDIFNGRHQGLIIVEVEFASLEQAVTFNPPDWFGTDVSKDPCYRNSYLSQH